MGAPQARMYETMLGLKKRGWDILIITAMPNYPKGRVFEPYRGKWVMNDDTDDLKIRRYTLYASHSKKPFPRIISMLSFGVTSFFSLLRIRKFCPDYIITESPPLTLGLTGLLLARLSGAKHIINVSDIWPLSALRLGAISEGYMYRKLEGLEHYLYKRSYACTGQSNEIIKRLQEHGSQRTHLFRNGVDFNRFEQARAKAQRFKKEGTLKIVYAGLLGVAQGVLDICRNINFRDAGAELHIYGEGSDKEDIIKLVKENPDRGVFIYPSVPREIIPQILMQYQVTLIPLKTPIYGAVPSKIYEAMAAGLPIIFSGGGEGEQLMEQYNTGWVCTPSDYVAIGNKIKEVAAMDEEIIERYRSNCINAAREVFNREIQIEKLDKFLLKAE